jgi:D-sedoheptulose 7-phosphate isomerase
MAAMDMSIVERVDQFGELLHQCVATDNTAAVCATEDAIATFCELLVATDAAGGTIYVVGNGGSAGIASHAVTDFMNAAGLKASTLHESSLLTCMANDYGYENAYARMLAQMLRPADAVIAISSSGQSINIRNAARQAMDSDAAVITLTGFKSDNPLRSMGELNFWLDSDDYGMVEIGHQFILHNASDRIKQSGSGASNDK